MNEIKDRVFEIRAGVNMSQVEFASRLGITNSHVSKIEKGKTIPSDALIKLICKEFKINERWLKYGKGEIDNDTAEEIFNNNMYESTDTVNKMLIGSPIEIQNLIAKLDLTFAKTIFFEYENDEIKERYLEIISLLYSNIYSYTSLLKQMFIDGIITLDTQNTDILYENFNNQISKNLKEIKEFFNTL